MNYMRNIMKHKTKMHDMYILRHKQHGNIFYVHVISKRRSAFIYVGIQIYVAL